MTKTVQFDVTVNMTLEIDADEWKAYLDEQVEEENPEQSALYALGENTLEGEEIAVVAGRAWVCFVDDISML